MSGAPATTRPWRSESPTGFTVRAEYANGSHEFLTYSRTDGDARRELGRLQRYWGTGRGAPISYRIVGMDRAAWSRHARAFPCRSVECPHGEMSAEH